jgi:hypothetical protein
VLRCPPKCLSPPWMSATHPLGLHLRLAWVAGRATQRWCHGDPWLHRACCGVSDGEGWPCKLQLGRLCINLLSNGAVTETLKRSTDWMPPIQTLRHICAAEQTTARLVWNAAVPTTWLKGRG